MYGCTKLRTSADVASLEHAQRSYDNDRRRYDRVFACYSFAEWTEPMRVAARAWADEVNERVGAWAGHGGIELHFATDGKREVKA